MLTGRWSYWGYWFTYWKSNPFLGGQGTPFFIYITSFSIFFSSTVSYDICFSFTARDAVCWCEIQIFNSSCLPFQLRKETWRCCSRCGNHISYTITVILWHEIVPDYNFIPLCCICVVSVSFLVMPHNIKANNTILLVAHCGVQGYWC